MMILVRIYRCWYRDKETPSYCHLKVEGTYQVVFNFTSNLVGLQCKLQIMRQAEMLLITTHVKNTADNTERNAAGRTTSSLPPTITILTLLATMNKLFL